MRRAAESPWSEGRWRRLLPWALTGAAALAGLALFAAWPALETPGLAVCFSRRFLGLPCPGCGMSRALARLARGDWAAALALHPLAPLVAAQLVLGWLAWGAAAAGRPLRRWAGWLPALLAADGALLVALWLGRLATGTLPR